MERRSALARRSKNCFIIFCCLSALSPMSPFPTAPASLSPDTFCCCRRFSWASNSRYRLPCVFRDGKRARLTSRVSAIQPRTSPHNCVPPLRFPQHEECPLRPDFVAELILETQPDRHLAKTGTETFIQVRARFVHQRWCPPRARHQHHHLTCNLVHRLERLGYPVTLTLQQEVA